MKENKDRSVSRFALSTLLLVVLIISTGLAIRHKDGKEIKDEPRDFVSHLLSENRHIDPQQLADKIIQEDPSLLMIDLRDHDAFKDFSLPGAVNIAPDSLISSEELLKLWNHRELVLIDNDERRSNATWLLAKQIGYENIFVLRGGLNAWFDEVLQAKGYNASAIYFGVHQELPAYVLKEDQKMARAKTSTAPKKEVTPQPKKKKRMPEGGC